MGIELKENEILVLKSVMRDGTGYDGIKYNLRNGAVITAPNWTPEPGCSNGIRGLPWGVGCIGYMSDYSNSTSTWLVVRVDTGADYIYQPSGVADECEFKTGTIEYVGSEQGAADLIHKYMLPNTPSSFMRLETNEDQAIQISGDYAYQRGGIYATQRAGYHAMQFAGNHSIQFAGDESTQVSEDRAIQTAGVNSKQTAGCHANQTIGDRSIQTAGVGSVQVGKFYVGDILHTAVRRIAEAEANKPYWFEDGTWSEITTHE